MTTDFWSTVKINERTRRRARRTHKPPLRCRLFGHWWLREPSIHADRPWCCRCGRIGTNP